MALRTRLLSPCRLRSYWFTRFPNFGDQLSVPVLEWVTDSSLTWVGSRYRGKILGVGSILQYAIASGDHVWGSGLIQDRRIVPPANATFLAVRGPLTRQYLSADIPEIYGDPALLLPYFHHQPVKKRYSIGIVPHHYDHSDIPDDDPAITVIDVTKHWAQVVDEIRSCEVIVSSSLHGVIVAEAYGIPATWIRISDRLEGGSFKFHDYLLATGRGALPPFDWTEGLSNAVRRPLPPMQFRPEPLITAAKALRSTLPRICRREIRHMR